MTLTGKPPRVWLAGGPCARLSAMQAWERTELGVRRQTLLVDAEDGHTPETLQALIDERGITTVILINYTAMDAYDLLGPTLVTDLPRATGCT